MSVVEKMQAFVDLNQNATPSDISFWIAELARAKAGGGVDGWPEGEVILEHSGCGHGRQYNQLGVSLYPGDKVIMVRGPLGKVMTHDT